MVKKTSAGFTLIEILVVVLVIGILAGISIILFPGAKSAINAGSMATTIDGVSAKISNWGAQQQNNFYTTNAAAQTNGSLSDIAKDIAPLGEGYKWAGNDLNQATWLKQARNKPNEASKTLFVGYCGDREEKNMSTQLVTCASVIGCLKYFSDGTTVCLENNIYPRGSEKEGSNTKNIKKIYCPSSSGTAGNCPAAIYTSMINGKPSGSLLAGATKSCGGAWPLFPTKKPASIITGSSSYPNGSTPIANDNVNSINGIPCSGLSDKGGNDSYDDSPNCTDTPNTPADNCYNYVDPTSKF